MSTDIPRTSPFEHFDMTNVAGRATQTPGDRQIIIDQELVEVCAELYEWLELDARDRGISMATAYQEEMEARRELARMTPPLEKLREMIRQSEPPVGVGEEPPSEYPF